MSFLKQLTRFDKIIGRGRNIPLHDKTKVGLMNLHDSALAGKDLVRNISKARLDRGIQQAIDNGPIWERLLAKISPEYRASLVQRLQNSNIPAASHFRADVAQALKGVDTFNERQRTAFSLLNDKKKTAIQKRPTRLKTLEVGERPDLPWWGVEEVANPNLVAGTRDFLNLPKNIRNAYDAGHRVVPASGYNLKDIIKKNYNS